MHQTLRPIIYGASTVTNSISNLKYLYGADIEDRMATTLAKKFFIAALIPLPSPQPKERFIYTQRCSTFPPLPYPHSPTHLII